jgi:hypothetical protein
LAIGPIEARAVRGTSPKAEQLITPLYHASARTSMVSLSNPRTLMRAGINRTSLYSQVAPLGPQPALRRGLRRAGLQPLALAMRGLIHTHKGKAESLLHNEPTVVANLLRNSERHLQERAIDYRQRLRFSPSSHPYRPRSPPSSYLMRTTPYPTGTTLYFPGRKRGWSGSRLWYVTND